MKKKDVLKRLEMASNLFSQANAIIATIESKIEDEKADDSLFDYMDDLRDGEDPNVVFEALKSDGYLDGMEEGD